MPELCAEIADRRIQDLQQLLQPNGYKLLSLDLFDTVVWRMTPTPADVFFLVAERLAKQGAFRDSTDAVAFVRERAVAEERARRLAPGLEVTLDDIYRQFPTGFLNSFEPPKLASLEFEIERQLVRVFEPMRELIEEARELGLSIAFVSDTYFTARQLQALVPIEADHWLASCEHGVSKRRGLHRVLVDRSGIPPEHILHVGDNFGADIEGPEQLGIDRYWFRRFPDAYRDLVERELPRFVDRRAHLVRFGDSGLTSLRSQAMYSASDEHERWGAGVLGPLVAGFADWVIHRAESLGIETALCLMREGRILKQVIDRQGSGLQTREAFLSRFTACKSSIFEGSETELRHFLLRPSPQKRAWLLLQLGLEADAVGGTPDDRLTAAQVRALCRTIARDSSLRRQVVTSSAEARARLLRHLDNLDLGGQRLLGLVDLGYTGTIQACLQRIFDRERPGVQTHGLYLVTGDDVRNTQSLGCAAEGWLAANGQPLEMADTFIRSPEIVEQSLMAPIGSTVGHEPDGSPVLDRSVVPENQRCEIESIQRGVLAFATRWAEHKSLGVADSEALAPLMRAICMRAVVQPLDIEMEMFGHWVHDENFGSANSRALIEASGLHPWEQSHLSAHQLASLPHTRLYWPAGFARTLSDNLATAVAHIFRRDAPPGAFDSGAPAERVVFLWDSGSGFGDQEAEVRDFSLGNRGRAWLRFKQRLKVARRTGFAFALAKPGQVVEVTGVRLHLRPVKGQGRTQEFEASRLSLHGLRPLHENLFLITQAPAVLALATPDLENFTGVVLVDLFMGLIPAS